MIVCMVSEDNLKYRSIVEIGGNEVFLKLNGSISFSNGACDYYFSFEEYDLGKRGLLDGGMICDRITLLEFMCNNDSLYKSIYNKILERISNGDYTTEEMIICN